MDFFHPITRPLSARRLRGTSAQLGRAATALGSTRNAGVGLRIVSTRAAFSNVLQVDLAFPLDAPANVKKVQFLVKTKTSF